MTRYGRAESPANDGWLTLGEASRTLGVTPNTLRRWADRGEVPSFTTPGGHRRFPSIAIESLLPSRRAHRPALSTIGASADHMVRAYRRARPGVREPKLAGWMERLTPADREVFRAHGVNLVGSLLAYLDARHQRAAQILATAELQAGSYGADAARLGASLSDAVEEFLRFRRPFVDELAQLARRRRLDTREATGLLAQAEAALDRMLIVLMLGHKRISGQA